MEEGMRLGDRSMRLGMRGWHGGKKETSDSELPMHGRYTMRREGRET
jgi:hypothetical protein